MWLNVLPLDVPTLPTSRLPRDPGSQRWNYVNLILDVPTFATSRLPWDPSSQRWNYVGEKWPMNFAWNARLARSIQGSFTCCKSTTWDRRLYCPSEGRRAEDFFAPKNPTAPARFEPATLGSRGQHATSRPPKPHELDMKITENVNCHVTCLLIWRHLKRNWACCTNPRQNLSDFPSFETVQICLRPADEHFSCYSSETFTRLPGHAASDVPPQPVMTLSALLVTGLWQIFCYDCMFQINKTSYFMYFNKCTSACALAYLLICLSAYLLRRPSLRSTNLLLITLWV
jgi:hypothetical protein